MLGVECSTVVGRLMMHFFSGVGCQTAVTASITRLENASSVSEYISGEYSKVQSVAGWRAAKSWNICAWLTASSTISSSLMPSTTRRITGAVALYRCTMARGAPASASNVRRISGSRAWVSTWMVTSSGMRSSSMSLRTKSNSTCEAEGNPTSISLKPIFTSCSNMRILRAMSMGSISA